MMDPTRIQEIIENHLDSDTVHIEYHRESIDMVGHMAQEIVQLVNGERVEPDYETATLVIASAKFLESSVGLTYDEIARRAVDAAIGDRLLINPSTEDYR